MSKSAKKLSCSIQWAQSWLPCYDPFNPEEPMLAKAHVPVKAAPLKPKTEGGVVAVCEDVGGRGASLWTEVIIQSGCSSSPPGEHSRSGKRGNSNYKPSCCSQVEVGGHVVTPPPPTNAHSLQREIIGWVYSLSCISVWCVCDGQVN